MAGSSGHPRRGASLPSVEALSREGVPRGQPQWRGWCEGRKSI